MHDRPNPPEARATLRMEPPDKAGKLQALTTPEDIQCISRQTPTRKASHATLTVQFTNSYRMPVPGISCDPDMRRTHAPVAEPPPAGPMEPA